MEPMQHQTSSDEQGWTGQGRATPSPDLTPLPDMARQDADDEMRRQAILQQTVEQDVIPRLVLSRRDDTPVESVARPKVVTESHVADLVALVVARDETGSIAFVEALQAAGYPAETLYLDLLAPTARVLGQMWTDDDCDFTDVTIGMFLLQSTLRELGSTHRDSAGLNPTAPRILLVPMPREQHTFGLSMVHDFFRRAGWNTWSGTIESDKELTGMVRDSWYDIVGFSLPCNEQLDDARALIRLVRAASLNPAVSIMVGGPGFTEDPSLAASIGADGTAMDGRQAVRAADALLAGAAGRQCS